VARDFNYLVNDRNGVLSTISKDGIVDFKISAVNSPTTCAAMTVRRRSSDGRAWNRVPPCTCWCRGSYSTELGGSGHRPTSRKRN